MPERISLVAEIISLSCSKKGRFPLLDKQTWKIRPGSKKAIIVQGLQFIGGIPDFGGKKGVIFSLFVEIHMRQEQFLQSIAKISGLP